MQFHNNQRGNPWKTKYTAERVLCNASHREKLLSSSFKEETRYKLCTKHQLRNTNLLLPPCLICFQALQAKLGAPDWSTSQFNFIYMSLLLHRWAGQTLQRNAQSTYFQRQPGNTNIYCTHRKHSVAYTRDPK